MHQFVTFTVHTPSQFAFAEFVARDPDAARAAGVLPGEARPVPGAHRRIPLRAARLRGHLLPVDGLLGDLAGRRPRRWPSGCCKTHGVAAIPVSAFLYKDTGGPVLRFCFAKKDTTLAAAAERLKQV